MSAAGRRVVVRTRLRPPVPGPDELRRSRLLARLEHATEPVVLLAAPLGSGKTVLLAQWVTARTDPRWAWLSLSRYDDSASGFWSGLLEAVRPLCPGAPTPPPVVLDDAGVLLGDVVPRLLNALAEAAPLTLVLDGIDAVADPLTWTSLDAFVPRLPDTVRLVVATARPPRGPIAALRAGGRLAELDETDLRFTRSEARALVESVAGRPLPTGQVAAVCTSMNGWAAGLRLSALALRREGKVTATGRPAAGVVDYLRAEVLERVTSGQRRVLLETSVLDDLAPPVCAAVTGPGAQPVLEELAASSLLLGRGPDGVLRYHPALRATLRVVLAAERPDLVPHLHARAAEGLRRSGHPDAALRHAVASGRRDLVAAAATEDWAASPPRALLRRLGMVPPSVLEADPGLRRVAAAAELAAGDWAAAQRLLGALPASAAAPEADGTLSAMLHLHRGELDAALAAAAAVTSTPDAESPWSPLAGAVLGRALLWAGELDESRTHLAGTAARARTCRSRLAEVSALEAGAVCAALLGDTRDAVRLANEAVRGGCAELLPPLALVVLAAEAADRAAPDATARARDAEEALADMEPHAEAYAWSVLAGIARRLGDAAHERRARARAAGALAGRDPGRLLAGLLAPPAPSARGPAAAGCRLSARELAVLRALRGPLSLREIGAELHLSHNTVKTHVRAVFTKLGVHDRAEAVAAAGAMGLLPAPAFGAGVRQVAHP